MRDDSRNLGPPAVAPFDLPAGWSPSSWVVRNLLGQDKEHSPRGNNSSTQTLAASGSVNPLAQLVLVTGTATATLESAVAADRRWHLFIHDIAAGGTVTVAGTPTINGAASIAISTRYACLMVWSDGTEWKAQQTDLATALGKISLATQVSDYKIPTAYTPVFTFATLGDLTVSYAVQVAREIIIGKMAYVMIRMTWTPTYTTAAGNAQFSLNTASVTTANYNAVGTVGGTNANITWPAGTTHLSANIGSGASIITLNGDGSATATATLAAAAFPSGNAKTIRITISYEIA
jgi:hypothetical protein